MAADPRTKDRDETRREGTALTNEGTERERGIETRREEGRRPAVSRGPQYFGTSSSPFGLMRRMVDDFDRLFTDMDVGRIGFGLMPPRFGSMQPWRAEGRLTDASWMPQVETFRREGNLVVRADLPGMTKDDISIEAEDDVLMISGERTDERRDERDEYYRTERSYGRFFRAIPMPDGVEADKIEATFKDGVLEVTVPAPKVQSPKSRQIKIR